MDEIPKIGEPEHQNKRNDGTADSNEQSIIDEEFEEIFGEAPPEKEPTTLASTNNNEVTKAKDQEAKILSASENIANANRLDKELNKTIGKAEEEIAAVDRKEKSEGRAGIKQERKAEIRKQAFEKAAKETMEETKDGVAESIIPGSPLGSEIADISPEQKEKVEKERNDLKEKLEGYPGGFQGLLEDYLAMEGIPESKSEQKERARKNIKEKLMKALGTGSEDQAEKIIKNLGKSDQLEKMSLLLMQLQLEQLLKMDQMEGTNHYEGAKAILDDKNIAPNEKVARINKYIRKIAIGNERLQDLNKLQQIASTRAVEMHLKEQAAVLMIGMAVTAAALSSINPHLIEKPETQAPIGSLVESGGNELANEMLGNELDVVGENTVAGWVKGERVFIHKEPGAPIDVFLLNGDKKIPVELTQPNAVGFDHARSAKAAYEIGAETFADDEQLRNAFLSSPLDERFMGSRDARRFQDIVTIIVGLNSPENIERERLTTIGIIRDGKFSQDYADAFRRSLELWASKTTLEDLKTTVKLKDLESLATMWERDREESEGTPRLTAYTLEEVRAFDQI